MAERKAVNKYIPPTFDPDKITKGRRGSHTVRLMLPFSMLCLFCNEHIPKGRKFNARKETALETYLTIKIYRFYIRCPTCGAEITFKTDPKNADYQAENGGRRAMEGWRVEKEQQEESKSKRLLEEMNNPMRALENRTFDSKREIEISEGLDELRMANARLDRVGAERVLDRLEEPVVEALPEEDEELVRATFNQVRTLVESPETSHLIPTAMDRKPISKRATFESLNIIKRKKT